VSDVRSSADLTEATASGLRWISVGRVVTELLLLGSMVVLARLIPPAAFGMFAIAVIVQELAINLLSEGVSSAIVQRRDIEREHLQGGFALSLAIGTALMAGTLIAAVLVVRPIFGTETEQLVIMTTPWALVGALGAPSYALLRRRLDFRRLAVLDLINSLVRSGTSILLAAALGLDGPALVLGGLAGVTAMTLLSLVFAPVPLPRWRTQAVRDLLGYGGPASLAGLCWVGFRNGDYAIIGARLGPAQAGIYWRGFQLAVEYQRKISMVMTSVAFPILARTATADELFALRRRMVRMLTIVIFPLLVLLVLLAPVAVPWLFGPAWESAVLPTQILAGAGAATVVMDAVGTVLMATGRTRAMLGFGVAHFAVYVSAVLVASRWDLTGVCIAAVVVHSAFLVVSYQVLLHGRPERTLRLMWDDLAAATVSCVGLIAAALPVDLAFSDSASPVVQMAVVGSAGICAYLVALRFAFPAAWADLVAMLRRVLPARPVQAAARRLPLLAGRSS
jgi:PST family polysaccharide transporter